MNNNEPVIDEKRIEQLELSFVAASGTAFFSAYQQAVLAGLNVLVSEQGKIYEVSPDGKRKLIKEILPPTAANPGQKFTIP